MTSIPAIFRALNRARVRYVLVGGYASVVHGVPRTTLDVDLALDPQAENVRRSLRALARLGMDPETDRIDEILGQGGVTVTNDRSVDLLTSLKAMTFAEVWSRKIHLTVRGARVPVVAKEDQIRLLRAAGRPQDLEDADALETR